MTNRSAQTVNVSVTPSQLAEALGRALLTWQSNETASARLYSALIKAGNQSAAIAGFYAVNGFAQRLAMLKSAARSVCDAGSNINDTELSDLLDQLADANRLRNRLSHSEVRETFSDGAYHYFLEVPEAAWSGGKQKDRRIDAATVIGAETSFRQLAEDIETFIEDQFHD